MCFFSFLSRFRLSIKILKGSKHFSVAPFVVRMVFGTWPIPTYCSFKMSLQDSPNIVMSQLYSDGPQPQLWVQKETDT